MLTACVRCSDTPAPLEVRDNPNEYSAHFCSFHCIQMGIESGWLQERIRLFQSVPEKEEEKEP